ncbi:MAG TPA: hypothetical protein VNT51_06585 [Miltoncostaeaceae bacterium]|nr:hypothetical protein [Miltoncostaeaceae bacterium]
MTTTRHLSAISPDPSPGEVTLTEFAVSLGDHVTDARTVLWTVVSTDEHGDTRRVMWGHTTRAQAVEAAAQVKALLELEGRPVTVAVARVVVEFEIR